MFGTLQVGPFGKAKRSRDETEEVRKTYAGALRDQGLGTVGVCVCGEGSCKLGVCVCVFKTYNIV